MCHIKMSFWDEKEARRLSWELPFYNVLIKKPRVKRVKNIDLLHELPFYDELSSVKISEAIKRYARSYKVEIIDSKEPLAQLEVSKSSIKDLIKDFLDDIKDFKHQITVKILMSKQIGNGSTEFASVYFNSTTETVINFQYYLDKSFE